MDKGTSDAAQTASVALAISATVIAVAYFVVVHWWTAIVVSNQETRLAKHETCYQEWHYNEAHQERWLAVDYCTPKETR